MQAPLTMLFSSLCLTRDENTARSGFRPSPLHRISALTGEHVLAI